MQEPKLTPELMELITKHIQCFMATDMARFMNAQLRAEGKKPLWCEKCGVPGCEICKDRGIIYLTS